MNYFHKNGDVFAIDDDATVPEYLSDAAQITEAQAMSIAAAKQAKAFEALSYAEKRRAEYPPVADYIDALVKGDEQQMADYVAKCLTVKAKYPKA
jgi:hypothetical protein